MKVKGKLKKYLCTAGIAIFGAALVTGLLSTAPKESTESVTQVNAESIEKHTDWYDLSVDEEAKIFELAFSPLPKDYKTVDKSSIKDLLTGTIDGIKNLFSKQVKLIHTVTPEPVRAQDPDIIATDEPLVRNDVFTAAVNGILRTWLDYPGGTPGPIDEYKVSEFEYTMSVNEEVDVLLSSGYFLEETLAYLAACGTNGSHDPSTIANRLGVSESGGSILVGDTALKTALKNVYVENGENAEQAEAHAMNDIKTIYNEAVEIASTDVNRTKAFIKIFEAIEDTAIPTDTVVSILGAQNCLDGVKDVFANQNVPVEYGRSFLNDISTQGMSDLCDAINGQLKDQGSQGFTKQDIKDAIQASTNVRLLEMAENLTPNGLNNISIILGKPVDYEQQKGIEKEYKSLLRTSSGGYSQFGNELVNIMMKRMTIKDIIKAMRKLTIKYNGVDYMLFEKPVNPITQRYEDNVQFKTHALVDFLNALPKMSEIRNFADDEMNVNFDVIMDTSMNQEESAEYPVGEGGPVLIHFDLGFQEKDCKYIRKLAQLLDDTFDLTISYSTETQDFFVNLITRNPKFVTNLYAWLCDSGVLKDRLLVELWDMLFKSPAEIADWLRGKQVSDMISMLKDIDYETALYTFTTADELNELFNTERFTPENVEKLVNYLAKFIHKASTFTFDKFLADLNEIGLGSLANRLNRDKLRRIWNRLHDILVKLDGKNISVQYLQELTNEQIYNYAEKLSGHEETVIKVRDYVIKFLDKLPERFKNKTVMDYYKGNGRFEGNGQLNLDWEKYLKKLPKGDKIWSVFDGMVVGEERPATFSFHFDSTFKDLYSITYDWGTTSPKGDNLTNTENATTKRGVLAVGSDVKTIGGISQINNKDLVHWVDQNDESIRVDSMPDRDIVVVPEFRFDVDISAGFTKVYDGTGSLTVTATQDPRYVYTYQWEKYDEDSGDFEEISGETNSTINVFNVLDSGTYRCVVDNGDVEVTSESSTVTITPKEVDISTVEWDYSSPLLYNTEEQTVTVKQSTVPSEVGQVNYVGNKATDIGTYHATATFVLTDTNNYVFKDDVNTSELEWEIKENNISVKDVEWLDLAEFEADGTGKCVAIDPATLPEGVEVDYYETAVVNTTSFSTEMPTEVGRYVTKVHFKTSVPGATIVDEDLVPTKSWLIYRNVDLSTLAWSQETAFEYDGTAHSVSVVNASSFADDITISYVTSKQDGTDSQPGNSRIATGSYKTVATISLKTGLDSQLVRLINDNVSGEQNAKLWNIAHHLITVTHVDWDYDPSNPFTYNQNEYEVKIDEVTTALPEQVEFTYINDSTYTNKETNAGNYTAKVELSIKAQYQDQYALSTESLKQSTIDWVINPMHITLDNITWGDYPNVIVYDGTQQFAQITGGDNFDKADITYESADPNDSCIDAGTHTVIATITSNDSNYVFDNAPITHEYVIHKKDITITSITWTGDESGLVYNGETQGVTAVVTSDAPDGVLVITTTNNEATDAGNYTATVVITLANDNYYIVGSINSSYNWSIAKAQVNISVTFTTYGSGTYDGSTQGVTVSTTEQLPSYVTLTVTGTESAENAGDYSVSAVLALTNDNYEFAPGATTSGTYNWSIAKAQVNISVTFTTYGSGTYDGSTQGVTVSTTEQLPSYVTLTVTGTESAENAGDYSVSAVLSLTNDNYEFAPGATTSGTYNWSIAKAVVYFDITWNYDPQTTQYVYEAGQTQTVEITNAPAEVYVVYTGTSTATHAGDYTVTATIYLVDSYNYEFGLGQETTSSLNWSIAKKGISYGTVTWSTSTFEYDGQDHSITVTSYENENLITVVVDGEEHSDAGSYEYAALFILKDSSNYELIDASPIVSNTMVITPKEISYGTLTWTQTSDAYTGDIVTITVSYENSDIITVTYTGNVGVNAGDYVATATFTVNSNYVLVDASTVDKQWSIEKAQVTVTISSWGTTEFTYDGTSHTVEATYNVIGADESVISVTYVNDQNYTNQQINANDHYVAKVEFSASDNYVITVVGDQTQAWKINKAIVSAPTITWSYTDAFTYEDGVTYVVTNTTAADPNIVMTVTGTTSANQAGSYTAKVTLSLVDSTNYQFADGSILVDELNWVINKKTINPGTVTWSVDTFEYDGTEKEITVVSYDNSNVIAVEKYENNKLTNAGETQATVTFMLTDTNNYILENGTNSHTLTINKKVVTITSITWSTGEFTYDGNSHTVTATIEGDDAIEVTVTGNTATNAGEYVAVATVGIKDGFSGNYVYQGVTTFNYNWVINKAVISVTGGSWTDETTPFVYNGQVQETTVVLNEHAEDIIITYSNNSATNAGEYEAVAILSLTQEAAQNYVLENDVITHTYIIAKKQISVTDIVWSYSSSDPFTYDGTEHSVVVTSYSNSDLVDVNYVNDEQYQNKATEPGDYTAKAEFIINGKNAQNYEIIGENTSILSWKIVPKQTELHYVFTSNEKDAQNNPNAVIQVETGIEENLTLSAKLISDKPFDGVTINFVELIGSDGEVKYAYEFVFKDGSKVYVMGENNFTIKILIPEEIRGKEFFIIALNADNTVSKVSHQLSEDGKYAIIKANSVKNVGIVTKVDNSGSLLKNPASLVIVGAVALGQLAIIIACVIVVCKMKKRNA